MPSDFADAAERILVEKGMDSGREVNARIAVTRHYKKVMRELLKTKPTELLKDIGSEIGYLHHHSIRTVAVASHPKAKAAPAHAATARSGQYLRGSPVVRDVQTFAASLCKMSDTGPVVYVWDKKNPISQRLVRLQPSRSDDSCRHATSSR